MPNLPSNIRIPQVDDPYEGFEEPLNINSDGVAAHGFYPQNTTSSDGAAGVERDASGNLVFKDANAGSKTLSDLATGGTGFGTPVTVGTGNLAGTSSLAARADHVHAHGEQTNGTLHAEVTTSVAGFMSSSDKTKLDSVTVANLPTAAEKAAMAGTSTNAPSSTNRFVDNLDTRLSNARTPTAHASTHAVGGSDPLTTTSAAISDFSDATKTVLGASVSAGTGISTYVNPTTKVLTVSNSGVTSVNGSTGAVTGLATTSTTISAGSGLSGGGDLSVNRTISMPNVGTAGSYGSASAVPVMTTDAQGRVSGVTSTSIQIAESQVTSLTTDLAAKAADGSVVHLAGAETITGTKTFSASPTVPSPSASGDAATKGYVDNQVAAVSGNYAAPVQGVTDLRAVTSAQYADKQLRLLEDKGAIYRYDTAGTGTDDGDGTIKPNDVTTGTGRWFKVTAATQDHEGLTGLLGGATSDHQHLTSAQLGVVTGATDANTASAVVKRDASGNFSAGTITAALTGNASTATKLSSTRTYQLTGDVTGSVTNDLASGFSISTTHGSLSGASMHAAVTTLANGFMLSTDKSKLDAATNANTASTLVLRDASGNFSAGTITATLSGNASTATSATSATSATNTTNVGVTDDTTTNATVYPAFVAASSGNNPVKTSSTKLTFNPLTGALTATAFSGPASSAGKLTTARTFALTGDVTGTVSSDLTSGASIATTHGSLSGASMHAAVTASANGFMLAADKSKLDAATNANTVSTLVMRDASGNFSAGTITAALSGNATTATKLQTARTINGVSFDGTANITVPANNSTLTAGSYLTGTSYNGSAPVTFAVDATTAATASKVVARDASGYVSANAYIFQGHTVDNPQVTNVLGTDLTIATQNVNTNIVTSDTLQPNAIYAYEVRLLMYNTSGVTNSAVVCNISISQAFQWLVYTASGVTAAINTSYLTSGSPSALMPTQSWGSHNWYYYWGHIKTNATLTSTITGTFYYTTVASNLFIARAASYATITRLA